MGREIKIGIFTAGIIFLLVWGYSFLKGKNFFENNKEYYIRYENVDQLEVASPVYIHGYNVGSVTKIKIDPEDFTKILVIIDVKGSIKIPKDTKAIIVSLGLVSGKGIVLDVTHDCTGEDCAQDGDYLQGEVRGMLGSMIPETDLDLYMNKLQTGLKSAVDSISGPGDGTAFVNDAKKIINNLASITQKLDKILDKSDKNLENSIANVESLTKSLKNSDKKIEQIIDNLDVISENLKNANIDSLVINGNETVASLSSSIKNLKGVLVKADSSLDKIDNLVADVNKGKGSLGKLMKDDQLYNELDLTVKHTNLLLQDIRLHPGRYINISLLKGKGKDYKKPEKDPGLENN
ncbi:MAG TPA: MCE family protein [Bacteroidetes bacterium]|nr:MCE family protein [Bacteroidota bacterium]